MNIPKDKQYHFIAGILIAIIGGIIADPITGVGFSIAAGIFKECYDDYKYGGFDIKDAVATWVGGCVGFTLLSLVNYWR